MTIQQYYRTGAAARGVIFLAHRIQRIEEWTLEDSSSTETRLMSRFWIPTKVGGVVADNVIVAAEVWTPRLIISQYGSQNGRNTSCRSYRYL